MRRNFTQFELEHRCLSCEEALTFTRSGSSPGGHGSLRDLGAWSDSGSLGTYSRFQSRDYQPLLFFTHAPEHTGLNTKIKPHDFL